MSCGATGGSAPDAMTKSRTRRPFCAIWKRFRLFCPTAAVTRDQMASFLARALNLPATGTDFFSDDEASQHEGDINRLAAAGIATGCGGGQYCPSGTVTREQMAAFLYRGFRAT